MAAAPANAAAALTLLTGTPTGKLVFQGFDLGQLVGATNDANCILLNSNQGIAPSVLFVSAATDTPGAGVIAIAQNFRLAGCSVYRYVVSTTNLQVMNGVGANGAFVSYAIAPTQDEWIAGLVSLFAQEVMS